MENWQQTSPAGCDLKYPLVWISDYRKPVVFGDVAVLGAFQP
jgi:hypothetical protein